MWIWNGSDSSQPLSNISPIEQAEVLDDYYPCMKAWDHVIFEIFPNELC
jgi:hypothetical protein